MERRGIRVAYIGLHPQTPRWLDRSPLRVVAVADLGEYLFYPTINPFNWISTFLYAVRRRVPRDVFLPLYPLWFLSRLFVTSVHRRYKDFLTLVFRTNVAFLDPDHVEETVAVLKEVDVLVVNAWSIFPSAIVEAPRLGTFNVHPSDLPRYQGALPTLWSLKNRDSHSAVTFVRLAVDAIDGGGVIAKYSFAIDPSDTSLTIERKVDDILHSHIHEDVMAYVCGEKKPLLQSGESSVTGKYESYRLVEWRTETARDILNKILLYPYLEPSVYCYANLKGRKLVFKGCVGMGTLTLGSSEYMVKGLRLYIGASDQTLAFRLFRDISFLESIRSLFHRQGNL